MYTENNTSPTEKIAHDSQGTELLDLAQKRFGSLTDAEVKLFQAISIGEVADYSTKVEEDNDPASSEKWGKERVLKADRIAWLCTDRKASALVTHMGIFVKGVRIEGHLDLQFVEITFPLTFIKSVFLGGINLLHAKIRTLSLNGTHTAAIIADGLKVEGNVFLRHGFKANGEVRLLIARIGGNLECDDAHFTNKGKALNADGLKVEGSVHLRNNFRAEGSVRLVGATIGGNIECNGGHFINPGEEAILALGLNVKGNVYLSNDFHAEGEVSLAAATIGGYLNCDKGTFINEGGKALNAPGMKVESTVFLQNGFKSEGEVYLFGATIGGDLICYRGSFNSKESSAIAFNAPGIKVGGSVLLNNGFKAIGEVCLRGATIAGYLQCDNGQFISSGKELKTFTADQLKVGGSVFLSDSFRAEGEVRLLGSTIGGDLECHGGMFINKGGQALNADGIKVYGGVFFNNGFRAEGEVRLLGATIGGDLTCHKGTFINNGGHALSADGLRVEGSIFLDEGFKAEGEVRLLSAIIGQQLNCIRGKFINRAGQALNAEGIKVEGNVHLCTGFIAEGIVNLSSSRIDREFHWRGINSLELVRLDLRSARVGTLVDESSS